MKQDTLSCVSIIWWVAFLQSKTYFYHSSKLANVCPKHSIWNQSDKRKHSVTINDLYMWTYFAGFKDKFLKKFAGPSMVLLYTAAFIPGLACNLMGALGNILIKNHLHNFAFNVQHCNRGAGKHRPLHLPCNWRKIQSDLRYCWILLQNIICRCFWFCFAMLP